MKKARKIIAMLLCMTLCIIPLPFSINAYVHSELSLLNYSEYVDCARCGSDHYSVASLPAATETVYKYTANVCCTKTYPYANMKCGYCHYEGVVIGPITDDFTHPTLIYGTQTINGTAITAWHCPACNYYHY